MTTTNSNQNKEKYWKLVLELGDNFGYDADEMHAILKYKFLSYKIDFLEDEVVVVPSTSKIGSKEFTSYLSKVEKFTSSLKLPKNFFKN